MTRTPMTTRTISNAEACDVARRLIAGSFRRNGERLNYDVGPRFSIPTRPDHDDDCLIVAYIEQREAANLVAAHEAEAARIAAGLTEFADLDTDSGLLDVDPEVESRSIAEAHAESDVLVRPSVTGRIRVDGETWVDTLRRQERHGLGSEQDTWRDAAFALAAALDEQTDRAARLEGDLHRMSLDELVALRERARNCVGVVIGKLEAMS